MVVFFYSTIWGLFCHCPFLLDLFIFGGTFFCFSEGSVILLLTNIALYGILMTNEENKPGRTGGIVWQVG